MFGGGKFGCLIPFWVPPGTSSLGLDKHWYIHAHPTYIRFDHDGFSAESAIRIQPATLTEYNSIATDWWCIQSKSQSWSKNTWGNTLSYVQIVPLMSKSKPALGPYRLQPFPKIRKNWLTSSVQKSEKCENKNALCCQNGPMQLDECKIS